MADLEHASENDTDLHGDTDAMHWAERFVSKFDVAHRGGQLGSIDVLGLMLTWFAGAIETGKMFQSEGIVAYKAFGSLYDPRDVTIIRAKRKQGEPVPDLHLIETAKSEVFRYAQRHLDKTDDFDCFTIENVYVVWFCRTLQNWKALVSTDLLDGCYYEVTYDGVTGSIYLDVYKKFDNVEIVNIGSPAVETEELKRLSREWDMKTGELADTNKTA